MPPFRISFLGRFLFTLCVLAAFAFCLYYVEAVLFSSPAPLVPSYDIAPQWIAAQGKAAAQKTAAAQAQKQENAAALAAKAQKQTVLAAAGGIKETDAVRPFFATADMERGRRVFARCAACHTGNKGGGNRIGPNLWGIDGRPVAGHTGFFCSAALKNFAQKQKNWDLAALDRFLYAPAKAVPGTLMFYQGVKDLQERADLLLYLESLKD